ncbi:aldo/keto reductase [Halovenus sp. WSH3]|uniref:Aldo/keto reductase n=1 Tax=Halovenus carboxidivorans TaxID=2692199 RepID=A0A6B0TBT2_9EURY|nr:aldo/keto reductase [Halovenus carboxidivorans]MXR52691.1 aldo/keto reductase [Halovenus carboxidivorans]
MEYVRKDGVEVPKVGVGTWQMETQVAYESVSTALELGYRHVDTAQLYENEAGVGSAIADADVDRSEIFLTTKVNPAHRSVADIVESVRASLNRLEVDQVDLLLIHWPHPLADLPAVIDGLNECVRQGLTRFIGVSNFGVDRLKRAQNLSDVPIFTNQVLFHPWWPQRELLSYCQQEDVILTGYSPLANGGAIDDDLLAEIGRVYDKSGPQVAIRWATQHENVITIPMSTSREHLAENIDVFDFKLTRSEHDQITRPSYLKTGLSMVRGQIGV